MLTSTSQTASFRPLGTDRQPLKKEGLVSEGYQSFKIVSDAKDARLQRTAE